MKFGMNTKSFKTGFFDRRAVESHTTKVERGIGGRWGAYVRQVARSSIRSTKSRKPSLPGKPPRSRTGLLKKGILFSWDFQTNSTVVGPAKLASAKHEDVPRLLEEGGEAVRYFKGKRQRVRYPPRPYMRPASEAGGRKLPDFIRQTENSIRS